MSISKLLTDDAVLAAIGERLQQHRIELELTQAELAEQAGVAKRTVERIEAGHSAQTQTLVRILRVLDLLPGIDRLLPPATPSPMELLKRRGKPRQRVASRRREDEPDTPWSWDDDR